ncbi:MAG TPA: hypothetical protein DIW52_17740 [Pseudomonas sp.]|nr:hypothetical protein [Pseudomonas sp.]
MGWFDRVVSVGGCPGAGGGVEGLESCRAGVSRSDAFAGKPRSYNSCVFLNTTKPVGARLARDGPPAICQAGACSCIAAL